MSIGNLHGLVRGAITSVNPDIAAQYLASTGNTVAVGGKATPTYATAVPVRIQSQPVSTGDINRYDFLSGQGVYRAVYMFGITQAIVRSLQLGGDLLQFRYAGQQAVKTWLVKVVDEEWSSGGSGDWCRVICVQQTDPNNPKQ